MKRIIFFSYLSILVLTLYINISAPVVVYAQTANEQEAKLKAEYDQLQVEIVKWQEILVDTQTKAKGIQGDITGLNAKIKEAELTIKAKNIAISQIGKQIEQKNKTITVLEAKVNRGKESLAQLIRKTDQIDSYTLPEVLLAGRNLSDFFQDLDSFNSIHRSMEEHFNMIQEVKASTEKEKKDLDTKKNQEADAKYVVETKKKTISASQKEKTQLLTVTKKEEKAYKDVLAERQARASAIRAALFRLRDTEGINFGQALEYATNASRATGVRAALILAILTQESDLGKNQGSCLITNLDNGDGVGKNTGTAFERIMSAPRDTVPFKDITGRLGIDWKIQAISCPPAKKFFSGRGFGGGMGPSQFIPSTWELFKPRIGPAVGVSADQADPWNPLHAFTATAIYMEDLGAVSGSYSAERNAACRYYSGAPCKPGRVPANVFYGDEVMKKAEQIQTNIDFLKGV